MRHIRLLAATAAAMLLATFASAQNWTFSDPVDESQAVPPTGSPATGTAIGDYDDVTHVLNITATASNFIYNRTMAHIHGPALPGSVAGILFDLGVAGSGSNYNNVNTVWVLDAMEETEFLAGLYYVNIHTSNDPGGAIRGQLNPVPEPASLIALAAGSALLLRRRKRPRK